MVPPQQELAPQLADILRKLGASWLIARNRLERFEGTLRINEQTSTIFAWAASQLADLSLFEPRLETIAEAQALLDRRSFNEMSWGPTNESTIKWLGRLRDALSPPLPSDVASSTFGQLSPKEASEMLAEKALQNDCEHERRHGAFADHPFVAAIRWTAQNTGIEEDHLIEAATKGFGGHPEIVKACRDCDQSGVTRLLYLQVPEVIAVMQPAAVLAEEATKETEAKWKEVANRLEGLRDLGDPFTSRADFAMRFGCATSTVHKAIKNTPRLHSWAGSNKQSAPKASSLNELTLDRTVQSREPDPADAISEDDVDQTMRFLISQAKPEERARLNGMSPDERRQLADVYLNDPDKGNRVLGRKA